MYACIDINIKPLAVPYIDNIKKDTKQKTKVRKCKHVFSDKCLRTVSHDAVFCLL